MREFMKTGDTDNTRIREYVVRWPKVNVGIIVLFLFVLNPHFVAGQFRSAAPRSHGTISDMLSSTI